jgi:hypothetical protein
VEGGFINVHINIYDHLYVHICKYTEREEKIIVLVGLSEGTMGRSWEREREC